MKDIISNELFYAVTKIKLGTYNFDNIETQERLWIDDTTSVIYICWNRMSEIHDISIYEFAYKCKEWAKDYGLVSCTFRENGDTGAWCTIFRIDIIFRAEQYEIKEAE